MFKDNGKRCLKAKGIPIISKKNISISIKDSSFSQWQSDL